MNKRDQLEEKHIERTKRSLYKEFKEFWQAAIDFLRNLFNIRRVADKEFTRQTILENIPFRGHTAWLLIFSIMVASVGLNANSTPVVIGAMLISPLMGPIMGIGYAVGTNDVDTFRKSALNFLIMVVLSVLTSFIYFKITPLTGASHELLARTSPTFFDVMIAFFGGLAGIVALTRKGFFNVISGVAIATALMPPLCTAGYGLAVGNMHFLAGALYLFLINSFYIALATFIVIKYLHFPVAKYMNSAKRRRLSRVVYFLALLVMIPSIWSLLQMYRGEIYRQAAQQFVDRTIRYEGTQIVKADINPGQKNIRLYLIGETVPRDIIEEWKKQLNRQPKLAGTTLAVYQTADKTRELEQSLSEKLKGQILEKMFRENQALLKDKDAQITRLTEEIYRLRKKIKTDSIRSAGFAREAKTLFPGIRRIDYGRVVETDFDHHDTLSIIVVEWDRKIPRYKRRSLLKKFKQWVPLRLGKDSLRVVSIP